MFLSFHPVHVPSRSSTRLRAVENEYTFNVWTRLIIRLRPLVGSDASELRIDTEMLWTILQSSNRNREFSVVKFYRINVDLQLSETILYVIHNNRYTNEKRQWTAMHTTFGTFSSLLDGFNFVTMISSRELFRNRIYVRSEVTVFHFPFFFFSFASTLPICLSAAVYIASGRTTAVRNKFLFPFRKLNSKCRHRPL